MHHCFDVDIAKEYGLLEAILLENLEHWIEHNKANGINYHDGSYWTFNSTKAFAKLFPYASQRKIQNALKKLIEQGILKTGNYNKVAYDRTLWYAFTEKGKCIMQKCKMEDAKEENGLGDNVEPIPDINTDINSNINTDEKKAAKPRTHFIPPTLEEVKSYCEDRQNGIDAQHFIDYYSARGWELSKGRKVRDWKACVRTWENNSYNRKPTKQAEQPHEQKPKEINVDDFRRADGTIDCDAYMRAQYS